MKHKIMIRGGVLVAALLCLLFTPALAETLNVYNGTYSWAYDTNGTTKLATGCVTQLVQTNGTIYPPDASGAPTGTDALLASGEVSGDGLLFLTTTIAYGTKVYVRIWNSSTITSGTYYNNSSYYTVKESPNKPDEWDMTENISTTKVLAVPGSITPASRGQGAQNQVATIEGDYFVSGATVSIARTGGSGVTHNSSVTFVDSQHLRLPDLDLSTGATVGTWEVKVTNPGALASSPVIFEAIAGPQPAAPQPASLYRGDSGKLVTIEGTGFQADAMIAFSDNGSAKVTYEANYLSAAKLELRNFAVYPSANATARTVTITNPSDAGVNTTTFTVSDPALNSANPSSGYRGNSFLVTVEATGTHFVNGQTTVELGSQPDYLKLGAAAVIDVDTLHFPLTVSPEAATGLQALTVRTPNVVGDESEQESLAGAFNIIAPSIASPNPASVYQGDVKVIVVTGTQTHFDQSATAITFETTAIAVSNITVESATSLRFTAAVPAGESAAGKTLTVRTTAVAGGTETVTSTLTVAAPTLGTLNPAVGDLGAVQNVSIPGTGTHFEQGETTASFGTGITVNVVTVESATALTASITIDPETSVGVRNVTVQTTNLDSGGSESITKTSAFTIQTPTTPDQVSQLRALAEPQAGSITAKWNNPATNYSGGRIVYTTNFSNWDALTSGSAGPVDVSGSASGASTREITGLTTGEVYYFKVFSYKESGGSKFFNSTGTKVAAVPMSAGGEGAVPLSRLLTLETGAHGINHFSLPFPSPWYIFDASNDPVIFTNSSGSTTNEVVNAYDLIKAINAKAGSNIVSTFAKWLGPNSTPSAQGIKIAGLDPEPDKGTLAAIALENGASYQLYITTPITLRIRNTL